MPHWGVCFQARLLLVRHSWKKKKTPKTCWSVGSVCESPLKSRTAQKIGSLRPTSHILIFILDGIQLLAHCSSWLFVKGYTQQGVGKGNLHSFWKKKSSWPLSCLNPPSDSRIPVSSPMTLFLWLCFHFLNSVSLSFSLSLWKGNLHCCRARSLIISHRCIVNTIKLSVGTEVPMSLTP